MYNALGCNSLLPSACRSMRMRFTLHFFFVVVVVVVV